MTHHIFVLGLDELGESELATLPDAAQYEFHGLLTINELQSGTIKLGVLLEKAQRQLEAFEHTIHAIVGYWDFPISMMVPILCARYGLPSKDLEITVKCEHKYWSRLEQRRFIEEYPKFDLIDIQDPDAVLPGHMSYPAWVKPIKSFSSEGAFEVNSDHHLQEVLAHQRQAPARVGPAFDEVLAMLDLPEDIAHIPGGAYMVEEAAIGAQCTIEGYVYQNQVYFTGLVDSLHYENSPSFLRYKYPSELPEQIQARIQEVSQRVITGLGLTHSTFNIEYFWDADHDHLVLLEVNTRHSQSHAPLFRYVDGLTSHAQMIDLGLGRQPRYSPGEGHFATASKWMHRRFADGIVHRIPTPTEIATLEQRYPGTIIQLGVTEGQRLSDSYSQDSYSYNLMHIFTTGQHDDEAKAIYHDCVDALIFEIEDR